MPRPPSHGRTIAANTCCNKLDKSWRSAATGYAAASDCNGARAATGIGHASPPAKPAAASAADTGAAADKHRCGATARGGGSIIRRRRRRPPHRASRFPPRHLRTRPLSMPAEQAARGTSDARRLNKKHAPLLSVFVDHRISGLGIHHVPAGALAVSGRGRQSNARPNPRVDRRGGSTS